MAKSITEAVWTLHKPDGYGIQTNTNKENAKWYAGTVRTPQGYVKVYAERNYLMLSIIKDGQELDRVFRGVTYTPRRIVTLAQRFILEATP